MDIHYTWIGAYRDNIMDRPAALKRAVGTSAKVYFWCLEDQSADFKQQVTISKNNLVVRDIEGFLKTVLGEDSGFKGWAYDKAFRWLYWYGKNEDKLAEGVKHLITISLNQSRTEDLPERTKIREFVNIKNLWNFFLLYTWGGYVLDTSVETLVEDDLELEEPNLLKCPRIDDSFEQSFVTLYKCGQDPQTGKTFATNNHREVGNLNVPSNIAKNLKRSTYMNGRTPVVDVWMLSCKRYGKDAERALKHHIFLMGCINEKFSSKVFSEDIELRDDAEIPDYHINCADAVIEALLTGMVIQDNGVAAKEIDWTARTWKAESGIEEETQNQKTITDLNLRKTLNRSHVIEDL